MMLIGIIRGFGQTVFFTPTPRVFFVEYNRVTFAVFCATVEALFRALVFVTREMPRVS